jgi:hypothetical protein
MVNKTMKRNIQKGAGPYEVMNPFIYGLFMMIFMLAYPKTITATTQNIDFEFMTAKFGCSG